MSWEIGKLVVCLSLYLIFLYPAHKATKGNLWATVLICMAMSQLYLLGIFQH